MTEEQLLLFLVQVFVVLGLARLMGEVFRRFDQPPFAGEILAGVLLGQTVLGTAFPELFHGLFPDDGQDEPPQKRNIASGTILTNVPTGGLTGS